MGRSIEKAREKTVVAVALCRRRLCRRGDIRALYRELGEAKRPLNYLAVPPVRVRASWPPGSRSPAPRGSAVGDREAVRPRPCVGQALNAMLRKNFPERTSFASTIFWARNRCRTCSTRASPIRCSSRSGTATMCAASRSPWPRISAYGIARAFYDATGANRDVLQNHLLQVVAHLCMDPPTGEESDAHARPKGQPAEGGAPDRADRCRAWAISRLSRRSGCASGLDLSRPISRSGLFIESWRWEGVPIYIRTGKNLPVTATEVSVEFRRPPRETFGELVPAGRHICAFGWAPTWRSAWGCG